MGKRIATAQIYEDTVIDYFKNCQIVVWSSRLNYKACGAGLSSWQVMGATTLSFLLRKTEQARRRNKDWQLMDGFCGHVPEEKERMRSQRKHILYWKRLEIEECFPRIHLHVNSDCGCHKYVVQSWMGEKHPEEKNLQEMRRGEMQPISFQHSQLQQSPAQLCQVTENGWWLPARGAAMHSATTAPESDERRNLAKRVFDYNCNS